MDGVLVDSADAHFHSWRQLGEEHGVAITRDAFAATFGRQNRDIVPLFFGPGAATRLQTLAGRKEELYREIIRSRVPAVPGAVALVRSLHAAGVHLAIGSSGPLPNVQTVLDGMGIAGLMEVIVSEQDVTRGKPDPQVFALACARLGLAPARCVVIEDAPAGVEAARAAGTRVVAVLMHHPRESLAGADLIVGRLGDLCVADLMALVKA